MAASPAPTPDTPGAAPFMSCSECRAPMRAQYFVMNDRPVCTKCRSSYAQRIAKTEGQGAMLRVGTQGALVALAGIVALIGVNIVWPPARIFLLIPIGYLVGKQMMKALDGYSNRRYQYVAVGLTYVCFLIGFAVAAGIEDKSSRERLAVNRAKMQGTMATQADALRDELGDLTAPVMPAENAEASTDDEAVADEAPAEPVAALVDDDTSSGPGLGLALLVLLFLPVIALLQFGLTFSAAGFMSLGYALYQAWHQTDGQGLHLKLSGPYRVGQGPIPAH
jgi:hypothetical protein